MCVSVTVNGRTLLGKRSCRAFECVHSLAQGRSTRIAASRFNVVAVAFDSLLNLKLNHATSTAMLIFILAAMLLPSATPSWQEQHDAMDSTTVESIFSVLQTTSRLDTAISSTTTSDDLPDVHSRHTTDCLWPCQAASHATGTAVAWVIKPWPCQAVSAATGTAVATSSVKPWPRQAVSVATSIAVMATPTVKPWPCQAVSVATCTAGAPLSLIFSYTSFAASFAVAAPLDKTRAAATLLLPVNNSQQQSLRIFADAGDTPAAAAASGCSNGGNGGNGGGGGGYGGGHGRGGGRGTVPSTPGIAHRAPCATTAAPAAAPGAPVALGPGMAPLCSAGAPAAALATPVALRAPAAMPGAPTAALDVPAAVPGVPATSDGPRN